MGVVPCHRTISLSHGGFKSVCVSGGVGQLLASVPHGSDGQLAYERSVCEERSREAGRLLEAKERKQGQHVRPVALGMLCLLGDDRSIQVRRSGCDGSVRGFGLFAKAEQFVP